MLEDLNICSVLLPCSDSKNINVTSETLTCDVNKACCVSHLTFLPNYMVSSPKTVIFNKIYIMKAIYLKIMRLNTEILQKLTISTAAANTSAVKCNQSEDILCQ